MRSFEDSLNAHKSELTEALIVFGEHKRVNKVLAEVEMQRPDFYKFYKDGQESRQTEVDELQYKAKLRESDHQALLVKYQATKKCWEDMSKEKDELQKRVDDLTELNRLKTIALQQSVNRTSPYVHEKIVALEQALKGGLDE